MSCEIKNSSSSPLQPKVFLMSTDNSDNRCGAKGAGGSQKGSVPAVITDRDVWKVFNAETSGGEDQQHHH